MSKTYEGMLNGGGFPAPVIVSEVRDDGIGIRRPLKPRLDLFNHSPDGFAWGYGGSGPAQLALALLADVFHGEPEGDAHAVNLHQNFKFAMIGPLDQKTGFTMTEEEIKRWVDQETKDPRP